MNVKTTAALYMYKHFNAPPEYPNSINYNISFVALL